MTISQISGYGNYINPYLAYLNPQMNNWNNYGYYNPAFMGVQNIPQTVSVPQPNLTPQIQSNAVNFKASAQIQTAPKKEGLSKGAKWGIGLGVTALAATGVYLATKGKVGSNKVKQLAEHIDFKPAKTYEDAIQFGKTHLGIKEYKGFEAKDIDVINWLNEGFVNVSNKVKGNIQTPNIIKYTEQADDTLLAVDRFKERMLVDKRTYGNIDQSIQSKLDDFITKNTDGTVGLPMADCSAEDFKLFKNLIRDFNVSKRNGTSMSFKDKVRLYEILDEYADSLGHYTYKPVSEFGRIYHECWHLLDPKILTRSKSVSTIDKTIARTVSDYATTTEAEYIAEVGRKYMEGIPLSEDVMALYKKYGGPALA